MDITEEARRLGQPWPVTRARLRALPGMTDERAERIRQLAGFSNDEVGERQPLASPTATRCVH